MAVDSAALADALRGRYLLERELGRGGMAVVFLARDLRHDRPVALKVLDAELVPTLGTERFQREIRMAARLQHPHILTVLDSGEAAGQLWFTMPFVDGESLRERLRRGGALSLEDALTIAREVADGLDYAHRHGVVHRDIKPENILLSGGHALIADFGIARALEEPTGERGGRQATPQETALTQSGLVVGTPAYMSPEQATGDRALGPAADVYSLGIVLYEMLAGEPPFTGPTAQAVIAKQFAGDVPSLRDRSPAVPGAIDAALRKALAADPEDRFATAAEFADALAPHRPGSDRLRRVAAALVILAVLGAAVGWWRTRTTHPADAGAVKPERVAVLPFQNVGNPADEYFADGVADAVRGKLSTLPTLQVIASSSSDQYRNTTKSPQEIGRELGAQYLVVGKVRWQKAAAGRVQVSPELIQAATATTRWQQPFDAPLRDVFRVQADIASGVAGALGLALGTGAREQLTRRPTGDLAAYDAFLRGERLSSRVQVTDIAALRRSVAAYEEAVALDSTFGLAWAQLSRARSTLHVNGPRMPEDAAGAERAAERAIALGPTIPQSHFARALYLSAVRREHARAIEEVTSGLRHAPRDAELLSMAGLAEQQLGRWKDAVAHFREAESIDPRSLATARRLARALLWLRRYEEARTAADQALRLSTASPDVLDLKLATYLGEGDLAGARTALREASAGLEPTRLIAHVAWYFNLFWVLDDEQQRLLLRLTPQAFDENRSGWALSLAQTHALRGDSAAARMFADSARIALEPQVAANPDDGVSRVALSLALALGGHRSEAIRQGELALKREPPATNAMTGPLVQHILVLTYLAIGENDAAMARLEPLLRMPYYLSPAWLRIDPTFGPLRNDPRFRKVAGEEHR